MSTKKRKFQQIAEDDTEQVSAYDKLLSILPTNVQAELPEKLAQKQIALPVEPLPKKQRTTRFTFVAQDPCASLDAKCLHFAHTSSVFVDTQMCERLAPDSFYEQFEREVTSIDFARRSHDTWYKQFCQVSEQEAELKQLVDARIQQKQHSIKCAAFATLADKMYSTRSELPNVYATLEEYLVERDLILRWQQYGKCEQFQDDQQNVLFSWMNEYLDVFFPCVVDDSHEKYLQACALHCVNHLLKYDNMFIYFNFQIQAI